MNAADRPCLPTSLVIESNAGGVAVTVCACGVLLLKSDLAYQHLAVCPAWTADNGLDGEQ